MDDSREQEFCEAPGLKENETLSPPRGVLVAPAWWRLYSYFPHFPIHKQSCSTPLVDYS